MILFRGCHAKPYSFDVNFLFVGFSPWKENYFQRLFLTNSRVENASKKQVFKAINVNEFNNHFCFCFINRLFRVFIQYFQSHCTAFNNGSKREKESRKTMKKIMNFSLLENIYKANTILTSTFNLKSSTISALELSVKCNVQTHYSCYSSNSEQHINNERPYR